jgi:hypothetical protein
MRGENRVHENTPGKARWCAVVQLWEAKLATNRQPDVFDHIYIVNIVNRPSGRRLTYLCTTNIKKVGTPTRKNAPSKLQVPSSYVLNRSEWHYRRRPCLAFAFLDDPSHGL